MQDPLEDVQTHYERRFDSPFEGRLFRLEQLRAKCDCSRDTSKSASEHQEKDDAAHATAKFAEGISKRRWRYLDKSDELRGVQGVGAPYFWAQKTWKST